MRERLPGSMIVVAIAAGAAVISACVDPTAAQAPAGSVTAPPPRSGHRGANQTCRAFGLTNLIRRSSALPGLRTKNFLLRNSGQN